MLEVKELTVSYGPLTIVDKVSFTAQANQWLMIVGPNGAGKSTILNAISQAVPYTGQVLLEGRDVARIRPSLLARDIGVLAQNNFAGYSFTVEEVVRLGRYAYAKGPFAAADDEDEEKVRAALELTGLTALRNQTVTTLSGGELQRTFLAQLFAQSPRLLLLDEPTNHLDLIYQKEIFRLLQDWLTQPGVAVISVVHDLGLALAYGSHALLLHEGHLLGSGRIREVMTRENLRQVFSMDVYGWMRELNANWEDIK